jgi:hypothetical protein
MPMTSPAKISRKQCQPLCAIRPVASTQTLRALEKRGIYCQPSVSIEHQHLARRYVLRGVESGGAVADMGRYCAYLDADGNPAPWLQQIDSISGNGRHAIVIAPELVRIEMLRIGHTYELAITRLWLKFEEGHTRPAIVTAPLFRGHQGTLAVELWNAENKALRGTVAPVFYTAAGEVLDLPERFDEAIRKDHRRGRMSWDASTRMSPWLRPRTKAVSYEVCHRGGQARLAAS